MIVSVVWTEVTCPASRDRVMPAAVVGSTPMTRGLIADPAARARLGGAARAYAEREFDIRRLGDQFEGHLLDVQRGRTTTAPGRSATGIAG